MCHTCMGKGRGKEEEEEGGGGVTTLHICFLAKGRSMICRTDFSCMVVFVGGEGGARWLRGG